MKKRILSIILTICMVIGLLPAAVLAEEIIIIKPIQDTDLGEDVGGTKILEYMEKQTATVPEDVVTPYGSSSEPLTLVEKEELYLTVPGTSTTIYTKNASEDGKRMEQPMSGVFKLQFTKSVAFDPTGSGKRNHIAILGFLPTNSSTANGAAHLVIMNADTNTIVKDFELDKDWFGWIGDLTTATANNFFAITAGDYNGDGRDSIVVYCTTFRGSGTSALKEFSYDGKNWNGPTLINVMRSDQEYYFNKQYMKAELYKSYNLAHKLGVALDTGDVNGDGIDDLIVVSSTGKIHKDYMTGDNYKASQPELRIGYGKKGTKNIGELTTKGDVASARLYTMGAPDVSVGDINGDGKNEIVIAGFDAESTTSESATLQKGYLRYFVYDGYGQTIQYGRTSDVAAINKGSNVYPDDSVWPQFSVECVNFDGAGNKDYVFINGYIYEWGYSEGAYKLVRASGSSSMDQSSNQTDGNFAFNFLVTQCTGFQGSEKISQVFIRSAAVGNFYDSNAGKQGLSLIVGFKVKGKTQYFEKKIDIYKDDSGKWVQKGGGSSYLYLNTKASDFYSGATLCAVDIGNDTVIIRYNSTKAAYTDPNVVAFLQAAPYFSELGAGNSATSYSYSESYTKSTSTGKEFSAGIGVSASFETPAVKTSVETALSTSISEEFTESLTTEFTTTFEANNKNQVIVRRTLLYLYCYDLMTGCDASGNPVFEECGVVVTVPQHPVLTSMSMELYDDFAKAYNEKYGKGVNGAADYYLDIISKNNGALQKKYYLNNEGNPFAYASHVSKYKNGFNMSANNVWMELSHSGGTSQLAYSTSVGSERSKTATDGVSVNLSVSAGSSFMGFGASAGITTSLESLRSSGVSTAQVTTTQTGGSVQNLSDEEAEYMFNWQLIGWKTEASDGLFKDVPFVGYAVKDASAPTPCVNDLYVTYTDTPGEAYLHWTKPASPEGRIPAEFYYIYETNTKNGLTFKGRTTETQYRVTSSAPSASYIVVAYDKTDKIRSLDSNEVMVVFAVTEEQVRKLIEQAGGDIDAAVAALKQALEAGQAEAIAKAVADLTAAYQTADELLKSEVGKDLKALEEKLTKADEALQTAIDQVQANLDTAVENLNKRIQEGDAANAEALEKAITDLTAAYQAADQVLKAEIAQDLKDLKQKLMKADAAIQAAVEQLQNKLDKAIEDLTKLINDGDAANAQALEEAIAELTAAYRAADEVLRTEVGKNMQTLEEKLTKADAALQGAIDQVQANLDKAVEDLTKLINDGDTANAEALEKAIADLTAAYKAADEVLRTEVWKNMQTLEEKLAKADAALQRAIDQVQANLDKAVEDLTKLINDGDTANAEALEKAIANLTAAYQAADELLKSEIGQNMQALEEKLTKADAALQANLDKAIDDLNKLIQEGDAANAEALEKAITDLTAAYRVADELLKTEIGQDMQALEEKLTQADAALQAAIDQVQANLDKAVEDLTRLINDGDAAGAEALEKAIADLTAAYRAADELLKTEIGQDMQALEEKLTQADAALQEAIDQVQANLDKAVEDLTRLINDGDAADAEALKKAIADLSAAYRAADEVLKSGIGKDVKTLEERLTKADSTLQSAVDRVQANLNKAVEDLNKARDEGDAANTKRLNAAVDALTQAYQEADALLKSETKALRESTEQEITQTRSDLEQEIADLRGELQALKEQFDAQNQANSESMQALASADDAQQQESHSLRTLAIAGLCLSAVSLLGNLALLALYLKKKIGIPTTVK